MDICLIRHGETDGNARRLLQAPETPLSPQGMAQARLVARRLADERIAGVLTSDLRRAAMTAEMIAEAAAVSLEQSALLRERNFGELRGLPYDGLGVNIFAPGYDPPGGETWGEFLSRIDSAWDLIVDVAARAGGRLAVVTHGYFLFTLAGRRLPVEGRLGSPPAFANTSVTVVDHNPPHAVRLLNCTRHLEGSGPLQQRLLDPEQRRGMQGEYGLGLLSSWNLGEALALTSSGSGGRTWEMRMRKGDRGYTVGEGRRLFPSRGTEVLVRPLLSGIPQMNGEKIHWHLVSELRDRIRQNGVYTEVVDRMARARDEVAARHFTGRLRAIFGAVP